MLGGFLGEEILWQEVEHVFVFILVFEGSLISYICY